MSKSERARVRDLATLLEVRLKRVNDCAAMRDYREGVIAGIVEAAGILGIAAEELEQELGQSLAAYK